MISFSPWCYSSLCEHPLTFFPASDPKLPKVREPLSFGASLSLQIWHGTQQSLSCKNERWVNILMYKTVTGARPSRWEVRNLPSTYCLVSPPGQSIWDRLPPFTATGSTPPWKGLAKPLHLENSSYFPLTPSLRVTSGAQALSPGKLYLNLAAAKEVCHCEVTGRQCIKKKKKTNFRHVRAYLFNFLRELLLS